MKSKCVGVCWGCCNRKRVRVVVGEADKEERLDDRREESWQGGRTRQQTKQEVCQQHHIFFSFFHRDWRVLLASISLKTILSSICNSNSRSGSPAFGPTNFFFLFFINFKWFCLKSRCRTMNSFLFPSFLFFEMNQNVITISEPCFICPTVKYVILLYKFAVSKSLNKWLTRDTNKWILLLFQRLQNQHIPLRSFSDEYFALFKPGAAKWSLFFYFFPTCSSSSFFTQYFPLKICSSALGVNFTSTIRGILDQSCSIWWKSHKKLNRLSGVSTYIYTNIFLIK